MDKQQVAELIVSFRSNPAFRKLVLDVLRDELVPEIKVRAGGRTVPVMSTGLLSYKEVQEILGCKATYVRKLVYNAALDGKDGYVDPQSLVEWGRTIAKRDYRERVAEWDKRRRLTADASKAKEKAPVRKRLVAQASEEATTQLRLVV